jgi:hypothetical protein
MTLSKPSRNFGDVGVFPKNALAAPEVFGESTSESGAGRAGGASRCQIDRAEAQAKEAMR